MGFTSSFFIFNITVRCTWSPSVPNETILPFANKGGSLLQKHTAFLQYRLYLTGCICLFRLKVHAMSFFLAW